MCTLSFIPRNDGYLVAMNRDELRIRAAAAAPTLHQIDQLRLLYPQEPSGGTWIGANSHGNLLALMNANPPKTAGLGVAKLLAKLKSRGEIIPMILQKNTLDQTERALSGFSFAGMHPFRLFGVFPGAKEVRQWSWDGRRLSSRTQEWIRNHWFSSSRSDSRAEKQRGKTFEMGWREDLQDPAAWLRSLHAGHVPDAGAFSVCVHRQDAATVSYTEVQCAGQELRMTYQPGNPCEVRGTPTSVVLTLAQ
jgi:Transport and Golgi organisation 2